MISTLLKILLLCAVYWLFKKAKQAAKAKEQQQAETQRPSVGAKKKQSNRAVPPPDKGISQVVDAVFQGKQIAQDEAKRQAEEEECLRAERERRLPPKERRVWARIVNKGGNAGGIYFDDEGNSFCAAELDLDYEKLMASRAEAKAEEEERARQLEQEEETNRQREAQMRAAMSQMPNEPNEPEEAFGHIWTRDNNTPAQPRLWLIDGQSERDVLAQIYIRNANNHTSTLTPQQAYEACQAPSATLYELTIHLPAAIAGMWSHGEMDMTMVICVGSLARKKEQYIARLPQQLRNDILTIDRISTRMWNAR